MIIDNSRLQSHIMYALSDSHMHKILQSTSLSDKSVTEIIREQDLPHSSAYKKIAELVKWGLLVLYKSELVEGKKVAYYKSTFHSIKIKTERQRVLSLLLFATLIAYSIHSLLESFELVNYQVFTKLCFIVSAFGLLAAYSFYQFRTNHALIGGIFGIAMIATFGIWMVGELVEAITITTTPPATTTEDGEYGIKTIDSISSVVMAG